MTNNRQKIELPKCIFCFETNPNLFNTKEHVLPESLGGEDIDILAEGLFCDKCQNKFGSKIESKVLHNYPFILSRILLGIPTKKGKSPRLEYREGILESIGGYGNLIYTPDSYFKDSLKSGQKIHTIVENSYNNQLLIRFLIKMGLQTIAHDTKSSKIYWEEFDHARNFVLKGIKDYKWPLLIKENRELEHEYITNKGRNLDSYFPHIEYNVRYDTDGKDEVFYLRYFYIELITPLIVNQETAKNYRKIELSLNVKYYEV